MKKALKTVGKVAAVAGVAIVATEVWNQYRPRLVDGVLAGVMDRLLAQLPDPSADAEANAKRAAEAEAFARTTWEARP